MKIWKVILAALVIFGAGVITGGVTVRLSWALRPARPKVPPPNGLPLRWWSQQRAELLERMDYQLKLSPEQHQRIEQILHESQQRMNEIWDTVAPRAREESRKTRESIAEQLNPEQRKKFDEVFKPRGGRHPPLDQRRRQGERRRRESTNNLSSEQKL